MNVKAILRTLDIQHFLDVNILIMSLRLECESQYTIIPRKMSTVSGLYRNTVKVKSPAYRNVRTLMAAAQTPHLPRGISIFQVCYTKRREDYMRSQKTI